MNEVLTIDEINERYDGEWVLLSDPEPAEQPGIERGRLLWHTPDHDEIWRKALELTTAPRNIAVFRVGRIPDDMVFAL